MYLEEMFKKLGEDQQIKDDNWRRAVLVALMLSVLQHHPEAYLVSDHQIAFFCSHQNEQSNRPTKIEL